MKRREPKALGRAMQELVADERALIALLLAGDRDAFEGFYRKHNPSMVRICTGVIGNRATAEEVAQDAWIAVLKGLKTFEGRASLKGWVYTILMNKARTRAKRDGRTVSFDGAGEEDGLAAAFDGRGQWKDLPELWENITPERIVEGRNLLRHVNDAIETLPAAQRSVMILRGQQDLAPAEVCDILSISEANLRVLLHRARLSTRNYLDSIT